MIHQYLDSVEQRVLATHRGHGLFTAIIGPEVGRMAAHNGIAQLSRSADRRVLREIILDGSDGRVLDVLRCGKMRLAGAEIHQVNALLAQFVGFSHHCHGGGRLDAVDSFRKFESWGRFRNWSHARFPVLVFLASCSLMAGSSFSRSRRSTISGTRSWIAPPSFATSRTSRELR